MALRMAMGADGRGVILARRRVPALCRISAGVVQLKAEAQQMGICLRWTLTLLVKLLISCVLMGYVIRLSARYLVGFCSHSHWCRLVLCAHRSPQLVLLLCEGMQFPLSRLSLWPRL